MSNVAIESNKMNTNGQIVIKCIAENVTEQLQGLLCGQPRDQMPVYFRLGIRFIQWIQESIPHHIMYNDCQNNGDKQLTTSQHRFFTCIVK